MQPYNNNNSFCFLLGMRPCQSAFPGQHLSGKKTFRILKKNRYQPPSNPGKSICVSAKIILWEIQKHQKLAINTCII